MRLVVVGRSGQLARALAAASGGAALCLDRRSLDLGRPDTIAPALAATQPDLVINAAAYTAVDRAESEPERAFAVNRDGAAAIAMACRALDVPLVHVSTDYVFDGESPLPYREDDPPHPLGVYGASKLAGEDAVRAACPRHAIVRTSWLFSATGHNFVRTMLRLAAERTSLAVVDDQWGCPTSADDLASTLLTLAPRLAEHDAPYGTFHYCGAGATTWHGFARAIFDRAGPLLSRRPELTAIASAAYPTAAWRPARSVLDCRRIGAAFGIVPRPWQEQLDDVLDTLRRGAAA